MDPTRLAQLADYVKQSRDAGQTYDQVRAAILGGGWTEDDVNEYLPTAWAETEPVAAAPAPVAAPPVVAPSTPVVAPTTPVVPPTYAAPAYGVPATPVGSGLGAWITAGWEMYKTDIGTIILATIVVGLLSIVTIGICAPPLAVGLSRMLLKKADGRPIQVGDVFEGFRYFGAAWLAFLPMLGVIIVENIIVQPIIRHAAQDGGQGLILMINGITTIIGWVAGTFLLFAFPYVGDDRGGGGEAISASISTASSDFFNFLIAVIVSQIIGMIGVIACGIGVIFTAPLTACITIAIYRSRFPAGTMRV